MSYMVSMGRTGAILEPMAIGLQKFVQDHRRDAGLTQRQLADLAGINQPTISDIERGQVKLPSADIRRRLALAFGVSHLDVLVAAGEIFPSEIEQAGSTGVVEYRPDDPVRMITEAMKTARINQDRAGVMLAMIREWKRQDDLK